jgi:repressor LexA
VSGRGKIDEVYVFVAAYIDKHGYPPTVREVQDALDYASPSSAHNALWALIGEGRLFGSPGRSLRLSP